MHLHYCRRAYSILFLWVAVATFLPFATSSVLRAGELRTWIDKTGKHQIEAEFVELKDGKVRLRKVDGKSANIPLAKLSMKDQRLVRVLVKRERNKHSSRGAASPDKRSTVQIQVGQEVEAKADGRWVRCRVFAIDRSKQTATLWPLDEKLNEQRQKAGQLHMIQNLPIRQLRPLTAPKSKSEVRTSTQKATEYKVGELVEVESFGKWKPAIIVEGGFAEGKDDWVSYRLLNSSFATDTFSMKKVRPIGEAESTKRVNDVAGVARPSYAAMNRIFPGRTRSHRVDPDPAKRMPPALEGRSIELLDQAGLELAGFSVSPLANFAAVLSYQRNRRPARDGPDAMNRISPGRTRSHRVDPDPAKRMPPALEGLSIELLDQAGLDRKSFSDSPLADFAAALSQQGNRRPSKDGPEAPPILSVVDMNAGTVKLTVPVNGLELSGFGLFQLNQRCQLAPNGGRIVVRPDKKDLSSVDVLEVYDITQDSATRIAVWEPLGHLAENPSVNWFEWIDNNHLLVRNGGMLKGDYFVCWRIDDLTPVYQLRLSGTGSGQPVISPGRKQIFIPSDSSVAVFDSATGQHLADVGKGLKLKDAIDITQDGKLLAGIQGDEIVVIDLATGSIVDTVFSEQRLNGDYLKWIGDDSLLARAVVRGSGRFMHLLYDWQTRTVWWRYSGLSKMRREPQIVGNEVWIVKNNMLVSYPIPDQAAIQRREKINKEDWIAVNPGTAISIDTTGTGSLEFQTQCHEYLKVLLENAGYEVKEDQSTKLIASVEDVETKAFGFSFLGSFSSNDENRSASTRSPENPGINVKIIRSPGFDMVKKTVQYTIRNYDLDLVVAGESVWKRRRSPGRRPLDLGHLPIVSLGVNESIDEAIERITERWPGHFGSQLPKTFVKQEFTEPLGESEFFSTTSLRDKGATTR